MCRALEQLKKKFPTLSQNIVLQIEKSEENQIDCLISNIFSIDKEDDVCHFLNCIKQKRYMRLKMHISSFVSNDIQPECSL